MKKATWTGMCTAIVGFTTAAMIAQTTPPPQSNPSSAGKQITLTGCLKAAPGAAATAGTAATPGTAGTTGTAGAAGAATETAADMKFLLTNAALSSGGASAGASEAAAAPTASAASTPPGQTYRLIANASSLSPHVGKKLELTGTVEDQNSGAPNASSTADAGTPALRVSSGKVIAATCSE